MGVLTRSASVRLGNRTYRGVESAVRKQKLPGTESAVGKPHLPNLGKYRITEIFNETLHSLCYNKLPLVPSQNAIDSEPFSHPIE